ncbi:MAG: iron complex outermembrane receptor protein [Paraglaciecola sp.]|jgi:iron complex outermembrane receptor protein
MKSFLSITLLLLFGVSSSFAQRTITGIVSSPDGPLIGASVEAKGSSVGSVTDIDGKYSLIVGNNVKVLVISYIGYATTEIELGASNEVNVNLAQGALLDEIVVTGSRSAGRTKLESAVPVDVIDLGPLVAAGAQTDINQILNYVAPSFTSNSQTISDGTDHIAPASLRGLGPDQVLVLINGKRRHKTSLVNVNGTFGRGNVGTDMSTIPVAAIEKIEILRDGASAQYGSDAIAGVINIILKKTPGLSFTTSAGGYMSGEIPEQDGTMDGQKVVLTANYGIPLGDEGGFMSLTGSFDNREYTNRMKEWRGSIFSGYNDPNYVGAADDNITDQELIRRGLERSDFNMRVGQSALRNGGFMLNAALPVAENTEVYAFGGLNYRRGQATGFYRLPNQSRTVIDIYPNGFLPEINSNIQDQSFSIGMRSKVSDWNVDLSNTYGKNSFNYFISNTLNASMGSASPTSFNAGGFSYSENTSNLDISRYYEEVMSGFNIGFGAEYRLENYQINAGEEASYTNYGLASYLVSNNGDSTLVNDFSGPVSTVFDELGRARPGGSQVFPGFAPRNEVNAFRNAIGVYVDAELDLTDKFLVGLAARFEDYSDFGSTINGKASARYKVTSNSSLRGAYSTGFRAPALHQLNYNSTSTLFVDGIPSEVGTFSNDSRPAQLLGIDQLKEEKSNNLSVGFTTRIPDANMTLSIDGYLVNIEDRIVLTGQFKGDNGPDATEQDQEIFQLLQQANATSATFFANAVDSETKGIDVVATWFKSFNTNNRLDVTLAGTFSETELSDVKTNETLQGKEDTFFDETSRIFLEDAVPNTKVNLTLNYKTGDLGIMLRNVYFGEVMEATNNMDNQQNFGAKIVTDLSVYYNFTPKFRVTIGSNNLLDVYPDSAIEANQSSGRFLYSRRSQQFGANGRFIFARIGFTL